MAVATNRCESIPLFGTSVRHWHTGIRFASHEESASLYLVKVHQTFARDCKREKENNTPEVDFLINITGETEPVSCFKRRDKYDG